MREVFGRRTSPSYRKSASRKVGRLAICAAALAASVVIGSAFPAHAQSGTNNLNPKLDCAWLNPDGSWISLWRYKNPQGTPVNIAIGTTPANYFTGVGTPAVPQNVGQPTVFLANQTPESTLSFGVTMPATVTSVTWNLSGNTATTPKPTSSTCASQPIAQIPGAGPLAQAAILAAVMCLSWMGLKRRRAGSAPNRTAAQGDISCM
jgi:hypothetical protein